MLALGVALAVERGEVEMAANSMWNQQQTVICYTPEEEEILRLANKLMGVDSANEITGKKSIEPDWVNKVSVSSVKRQSMDSE
jgi:hypothetical protein